MSKLTAGTYEKYNAKYSTLTLTDGEYALTVTPEKGGMATSFTKSGEEYLWLRDKNYESSDRPRCGVPILFPSCGKPDGGVGNGEFGSVFRHCFQNGRVFQQVV